MLNSLRSIYLSDRGHTKSPRSFIFENFCQLAKSQTNHDTEPQEDRMIILEPNGRLDRSERPRRSLLQSFWVKLAQLLMWR